MAVAHTTDQAEPGAGTEDLAEVAATAVDTGPGVGDAAVAHTTDQAETVALTEDPAQVADAAPLDAQLHDADAAPAATDRQTDAVPADDAPPGDPSSEADVPADAAGEPTDDPDVVVDAVDKPNDDASAGPDVTPTPADDASLPAAESALPEALHGDGVVVPTPGELEDAILAPEAALAGGIAQPYALPAALEDTAPAANAMPSSAEDVPPPLHRSRLLRQR